MADGRIEAKDDLLDNAWDRTNAYDFAGRLIYNQFGMSGGKRVYQQINLHDGFSQISDRGVTYWGDTLGATTTTFQNGRITFPNPPTYDAAGNITYQMQDTDHRQWTTIDAAGRRTSLRDRWKMGAQGSQEDETAYVFDGEGRPVIELQGIRHITPYTPDPMVMHINQYQIWSTVLGASLTTVEPDGDHMQTNVYAGGTHIATQNAALSQIEYQTSDPVTGTKVTWAGAGTYSFREESEPLGQKIQVNDPGSATPTSYEMIIDSAQDPEWHCQLPQNVGNFRNMPVNCKKAAINRKDFSIPYDVGFTIGNKRDENPANLTKLNDSPVLKGDVPGGSPSNPTLAYAARATHKPSKDTATTEDDPDKPSIGTFNVDVNGADEPRDLLEHIDASVSGDCDDRILMRVSVSDKSSDGAPSKFPYLHRDIVADFNAALKEISDRAVVDIGKFDSITKSGIKGQFGVLQNYQTVGFTELFRTYDHQKMLYEKRNAGQSRFPAANPDTYGFHQLGVAFDIKVATQALKFDGKTVKQIFESHNFVWFGPGDKVHFTHKKFWDTLQGPSNLDARKRIADKASSYYNKCLR